LSAHWSGCLINVSLNQFVSMTAAHALHLHGQCLGWGSVTAAMNELGGWMVAPNYDQGSCCVYEGWRFGSVRRKTRHWKKAGSSEVGRRFRRRELQWEKNQCVVRRMEAAEWFGVVSDVEQIQCAGGCRAGQEWLVCRS
jgi:hypothetical protein